MRFGAALLAAALVIYLPALGGGFLSWDDTQHLDGVRAFEISRFWTAPYYGLYIPLTYSAWSVLWRAFAAPWAFHLFNVGLHALNAWFVYVLGRRWLGGRGAWLAACVFLVHPLQVEAVAWISGGRDVLATTFGLAALVFDSRLAYAASLLSKPFLFSWGVIAKRSSWLLMAAVAGVALWSLQSGWAGARVGAGSVRVALDTLGVQAWHVIAPWTLHADYGRTPAALDGWAFVVGGLLVLLLACFSRYLRWSVLTLAPVLGLVPFAAQTVSTVFDRYMYAPMIFVALLCGRARWPWLLIVPWAVLSFWRAGVWSSDRALAEDMVAGAPSGEPGLVNLARVELNDGRVTEAIALLRRAPSGSAVVRGNLAYALWEARDVAGAREAVAVLGQPEFIVRNAHEPAALALMWRMDARVRAALGSPARESYCRAFALAPGDTDLRSELRAAKVECRAEGG